MLEVNKVYQGECSDIMKNIDDKSIDMILTSPPYDNLRDYEGYTFNFEVIAKEIYRVLKDGGVCVWVVGDATINGSETGTSFKQALYFKEIGFNLHDTMIYKKPSASFPETTRYYQIFEYMFIFSKGNIKTINLLKDRKNKWGGSTSFGKPSFREKDGSLTIKEKIKVKEIGIRFNIWEYSKGYGYSAEEDFCYEHPAIFPEKLAKDHIISWSNEGDTILDPMAGSGTTLKMAKKTNRNFIGIEISPKYIDIINKRLTNSDLIWTK